ncbi:MAG: hypothetical protein Q8R47_01220 [Nanoarchaeota archaeon]|nr:hypothetical protein [Nanoarchaeota archaeon]
METKKGWFFYKIRYDLASFLSVVIVIILLGVLFTFHDNFIRWASFQYLEFSLLLISLTLAITHFFLGKTRKYMHKRKILAVFALFLIALILISSLFIAPIGPFNRAPSEYNYGFSIEECKKDGYYCLNYQFFGFGKCNKCRKLIVDENDEALKND